MKNLLIKLTIFYQIISIFAAIFIGIYQWYENDKIWPLIIILLVVIPMMITYIIVLAHVMKAVVFLADAETKERMHGIRNLYPVSKGMPAVATSPVKNATVDV